MTDTVETAEQDIESIPQTTKVFEAPTLIFDQHDWQQEGYFITDVCSPSRPDCQHVGIPIPSGKVLVKKGGHYDLRDE